MKLVTMTSELCKRFGDEVALRMIKEAGFDGYDFSMFDYNYDKLFNNDNYLEYVKNLRKISDEIGLPCLQAHAPSPNMRTIEDVKPLTPIFLRAIEIAKILGTEILVVHPGSFLSAEENKEYLYDKLLDYAKEQGVKIATENMFKWKDETETETVPSACGTGADFVRHIDYINNANFTACLDLGHASMVNCEGAVKMIYDLGSRISALHVHDNDLYDDKHVFPFQGDMDWVAITKALKEIGYKGHFTFEADCSMSRYPNELLPYMLVLLEKTGRYLINLIEN